MSSNKVAYAGNTSACAEKSTLQQARHIIEGKYLRMHGEEDDCTNGLQPGQEIPPHARRRALNRHLQGGGVGNTSACAEKRLEANTFILSWGKYLRMRGEEETAGDPSDSCWEIPPHARRRAALSRCGRAACGNTSACAEKSLREKISLWQLRKYLRMRGEEG